MIKERTTLAKRRKQKATPQDLRKRAMLARLKNSRWGAKATDEEAGDEIAKANEAEGDVGEYKKVLLKSEHLAAYRACQRQARRVHRFLTAPWDNGVGLLPADMFFRYQEEIGKIQREAEQHYIAFEREYAEQWASGMGEWRKRLKGLFKEEDYPDPKNLRKKFGIRIRIFPITDPDDFRVALSGDTANTIRSEMQEDFRDDLGEAMRAPIVRLYKMIAKVETTLKNEDKIFRDSLIDNVKALTDILPSLNILNDPEISKLIKTAKEEISEIDDIRALRKDPKYRKEVAKSASSLLKQMKGYV